MAQPNRHRTISRTIVISKCHGQMLDDHGEFCDFYAEIAGDYTLKRATSKLRRELADPSITINNIEKDVGYYTMPLRDFISYSTRKETK